MKPVRELTEVVNGAITSIHFETSEEDVIVTERLAEPRPTTLRPLQAYGAVEGRIQTLSNRGGLRFTLYDKLYDRAVSCYLEEGREDLLRDAWGKLAVVEGWVSRDPLTGRPVAVRHVTRLEPLSEPQPGNIRLARGVVKLPPEAPSPEDAIRRLRDA